MKFFYTPSFIRQFDGLEPSLKQEVREKIVIFQSDIRHPSLRTHKLKEKLQGRFSFSVNYQYRIVFCYDKPDAIVFLDVGDHDVYR
ncbi:MAG: type II toxin-antitoxin system RelE/ParE family toxin [Candidatus Peribacteraceae bacterium]|nr:type II toxin-antitoxin system RelE/ParE family toxin [Candidatus Peribacteraceae bacterium]MBP9850392.1 type II toxin-antitoxin system RelE/ParE family toxin [Candidatus Peribacteraceae bacterium]